jgi:DNA-binding IclR family transcriptional regulator
MYELAGPHLVELARHTGEAAHLGIRIEGEQALYLRHIASPNMVQTVSWAGRTIPLDGTAVGAALRGLTGPHGYAATRTTLEPDVTAVAAPITGANGDVVAALSVTAPTYRTSDDHMHAIGLALVQHADALSKDLGANGATLLLRASSPAVEGAGSTSSMSRKSTVSPPQPASREFCTGD